MFLLKKSFFKMTYIYWFQIAFITIYFLTLYVFFYLCLYFKKFSVYFNNFAIFADMPYLSILFILTMFSFAGLPPFFSFFFKLFFLSYIIYFNIILYSFSLIIFFLLTLYFYIRYLRIILNFSQTSIYKNINLFNLYYLNIFNFCCIIINLFGLFEFN